jgi:hypothetical protein
MRVGLERGEELFCALGPKKVLNLGEGKVL